MKLLHEYLTGPHKVKLYVDGTKTRELSGTKAPRVPESVDVKMTNYCDMGCAYCHESSTRKGVHADVDDLLNKLCNLPKGVELAIGGGNPLDHPQLTYFLNRATKKGFVCNLTVNQGHVNRFSTYLLFCIKQNLIHGLGISVNLATLAKDVHTVQKFTAISDNIVFHVIAGVHHPSIVQHLKQHFPNPKILVLGYKQFGFGKQFYNNITERYIYAWQTQIQKYLGNTHLAFDNLALEQLAMKRFFTDKEWSNVYMGDDFQHSMYYDAVLKMLAPTSRSETRVSSLEKTLVEFYDQR